MDGRWTVEKKLERDGHGSWTVRSRKLDGMVTEAGRDGHGTVTMSGQKRKIYCTRWSENICNVGNASNAGNVGNVR